MLCFFILSCSRIEIFYKFAPKVIADKADDAFDFKSDRYKKVCHQIESDLHAIKLKIISQTNDLIDYVLKYYSGEDSVRSAFYAKDLLVFEKNLIQLELEIGATLTRDQKGYFQSKLKTLKKDLLKLAEK